MSKKKQKQKQPEQKPKQPEPKPKQPEPKPKQLEPKPKPPTPKRQGNDRDGGIAGAVKKCGEGLKRWAGELIWKRITPEHSEESAGLMTMPPSAKGDTAFRFTGLLTLAIMLLVMLFGGILGVRLYSVMGMGNNRDKNIPAVYLRGGDTLKFKGALMETPAVIAEGLVFDGDEYSLEKNTAATENGKQLLYLNNISKGSGELYLRNTDREKPRGSNGDSRGLLIAAGVLQGSFRFVNEDKAMLYMRTGPYGYGGKDLIYYSNGQEKRIDGDVMDVLGMSEDNYLYYTVQRLKPEFAGGGSVDGTYSLHRADSHGEIQIIADKLDGQVVEFIPEADSVLFSLPAPAGELGNTQFALVCWDGDKLNTVADAAGSVVDFGENNGVFYTEITVEQSNPMQYFEDDMAVQDAAMTEPSEESFMVETVNLWGRKKTELDQKAYDEAVAAYEAKLNRDNIRKSIAAQDRKVKKSTLYYSIGGSVTMLDSNIAQMVDADAGAGTAVYVKERIPAPQKFKISQVLDTVDSLRMLNTVLITTVHDYCYASVGREPEVFLNLTKSERVRMELDEGRGVYFIKEDKKGEGAPLNYISVQQDGLGVAKKVDDKVISLTGMRYRDSMLYLREDGSEDTVTVCGASGAGRERMVDGLPIYPLPVAYGEVLLAYRDYNDGRQTGSLTMYTGGKVKPVARDVHGYSYRLPGYVYLLRDYDTGLGEGDLYLYSGNSEKLTLVDRSVSAVRVK